MNIQRMFQNSVEYETLNTTRSVHRYCIVACCLTILLSSSMTNTDPYSGSIAELNTLTRILDRSDLWEPEKDPWIDEQIENFRDEIYTTLQDVARKHNVVLDERIFQHIGSQLYSSNRVESSDFDYYSASLKELRSIIIDSTKDIQPTVVSAPDPEYFGIKIEEAINEINPIKIYAVRFHRKITGRVLLTLKERDKEDHTKITLVAKAAKIKNPKHENPFKLLESRFKSNGLIEVRYGEKILFPKLKELWAEVKDMSIDDALSDLEQKSKRRNQKPKASAFGFEIQGEWVSFGGPLIISILCLYLFIHISHLSAIPSSEFEDIIYYPWVGLYIQPLARIFTIVSIAILPSFSILIVCFTFWIVDSFVSWGSTLLGCGALILGLLNIRLLADIRSSIVELNKRNSIITGQFVPR